MIELKQINALYGEEMLTSKTLKTISKIFIGDPVTINNKDALLYKHKKGAFLVDFLIIIFHLMIHMVHNFHLDVTMLMKNCMTLQNLTHSITFLQLYLVEDSYEMILSALK